MGLMSPYLHPLTLVYLPQQIRTSYLFDSLSLTRPSSTFESSTTSS